jgi:hypothetical protein
MEKKNQGKAEGNLNLQPFLLSGHITDNRLRPLAKVKIVFQGIEIGESANDGYFSVKIPKPSARIALTFESAGFVSNTRVFDAKSNYGNGNTIVIWPVAYQVKFDSKIELNLELGGSHIRVPAKALIDQKGKVYEGTAKLQYTLFDVTDPFERSACSGDFSGKMLDASIQRLNSFGIFQLDISATDGQVLQLRPDSKIELSIPIPRKLAELAPQKIGFFNFDQREGRWVQIGYFDRDFPGLYYNGYVTSLGGAHNLDDPQDTTCVTLRVANFFDNAPLPNMQVTVHGLQYNSYGTTNSNGLVCLLVQRNATFTVTASGTIGSSHYGTPYPATFTSPNFSSGTADCGNSTTCPLLGTVYMSLIVGLSHRHLLRLVR